MALNKNQLQQALLDAMKDQNNGEVDKEGNMEKYAAAIADAIHAYVRTGEVNVPGQGNKPVR